MADRRLQKYARTPIASARAGEMVKIVGWVRASGPAFTAPLTGESCVWYVTRVEPYRPWYAAGPPVIEVRSQDLQVHDESGSAVVRMDRAEVRLASMGDSWQREPSIADDRYVATTSLIRAFLEMRGVPIHDQPAGFFQSLLLWQRPPNDLRAYYREDVLREGTRVAVLGRAWQEPDPTAPPIQLREPALRLVLGEAPHGVIVSTETDAF
jgi:hypothetical protein